MGSRPAVSTSTTSFLRAFPALTASKLTEAGSPPSWLMISTVLRSAQTVSCSRAAARKVSAAANSTLAPLSARCLVSLPMLVVLPAPLTPATMTTVGVCWPITKGFCSACNNSVNEAISAFFRATGWVMPLDLARWRKSLIRVSVACTPASAISSAPSRFSYKASSTWLPPKTPEMLLAVLPKPALSLSSHFCRSGGVALGAGMSIAAASTLPIIEPAGKASDGDAVAASETGTVAEGGVFFLKKLNIGVVLRITPFYETPTPLVSVAACSPSFTSIPSAFSPARPGG